MEFISDADYTYDAKNGRWYISDAQFKKGLESQKSKLEREIRQNQQDQEQLKLFSASTSNNVGEANAESDNYNQYPPGSIYAEAALSLKEMNELVNTPSNKIRDILEMQKKRRNEIASQSEQAQQKIENDKNFVKQTKAMELMNMLTGSGKGIDNNDLRKKSNEEESKVNLHSGSINNKNKPMTQNDIKVKKSYELLNLLTSRGLHLT